MTCNHGYWLTDCALCVKREHECDYGSCTAEAAILVLGAREGRRACLAHVERVTWATA